MTGFSLIEDGVDQNARFLRILFESSPYPPLPENVGKTLIVDDFGNLVLGNPPVQGEPNPQAATDLEMTQGTVTSARTMTPRQVAQAIVAKSPPFYQMASTLEAQAGSSSSPRSFSPALIAAAIAALSPVQSLPPTTTAEELSLGTEDSLRSVSPHLLALGIAAWVPRLLPAMATIFEIEQGEVTSPRQVSPQQIHLAIQNQATALFWTLAGEAIPPMATANEIAVGTESGARTISPSLLRWAMATFSGGGGSGGGGLPPATQAEMEQGVVSDLRYMSPLNVKQAIQFQVAEILANWGGGGGAPTDLDGGGASDVATFDANGGDSNTESNTSTFDGGPA